MYIFKGGQDAPGLKVHHSMNLVRMDHPISKQERTPTIWAEVARLCAASRSSIPGVTLRIAPRIGLRMNYAMSAVPKVAPRMPKNCEGRSADGLSTQSFFCESEGLVPTLLNEELDELRGCVTLHHLDK